jgi:hypothetical protein
VPVYLRVVMALLAQTSFWPRSSSVRTWASRKPGAGRLPGKEPGSRQQAEHACYAKTA